jgi:protocatechuate 3,4-dioxygenase beta subunit
MPPGFGGLHGQGGLGTTFQRGAYKTTDDGTVRYLMIFPGHYDGRATHIHVMARNPVTITTDSAVSGNEWENNVRHTGQIYFDESLRAEVEKLPPYNSNKQHIIKNVQDGLAANQASADYDPFVKYFYLNGKDVIGTAIYQFT